MYVSFPSLGSKMTINPAWKDWITLLLGKKVTIPYKYTDFADIFLKKSAEMLPKCIGINKYAIKLEWGK